MKVKILSGNQAGAVVEMRQDEGEVAVATGYAEVAVFITPAEEPPAEEPEIKKAKKKDA